ncbi:SOS response-associated peptidase [Tsukamurella spumae]|uniref:Abasic site processing protein n=1 Tax=Tsukamurella spumae TaxID=44753 RepID=A0A846WZB1_9ACTN|nr:SOS response-associated peptidase [Tsukamurella spumae]NKY18294.1 SOS response-associated peptidase [Tsukamurella spumae]
MCGRYAVTTDPALLAGEIDAVDETAGVELDVPGYNVAPTTTIVTVVARHSHEQPDDEPTRRLRAMRWGLLPHWQKTLSGPPLFNARAESVAEKPAFRTAIKNKRCLIPMDGWYEWQVLDPDATKPRKQPMYLTPQDGTRMYIAGLWSVWRPAGAGLEAPPVLSATVLTTDSVGPLRAVHDRMPLVLTPELFDQWLDPDGAADPALLLPPALEVAERIEIRPVSTLVNTVKNDGPALIERTEPGSEPGQLSLL